MPPVARTPASSSTAPGTQERSKFLSQRDIVIAKTFLLATTKVNDSTPGTTVLNNMKTQPHMHVALSDLITAVVCSGILQDVDDVPEKNLRQWLARAMGFLNWPADGDVQHLGENSKATYCCLDDDHKWANDGKGFDNKNPEYKNMPVSLTLAWRLNDDDNPTALLVSEAARAELRPLLQKPPGWSGELEFPWAQGGGRGAKRPRPLWDDEDVMTKPAYLAFVRKKANGQVLTTPMMVFFTPGGEETKLKVMMEGDRKRLNFVVQQAQPAELLEARAADDDECELFSQSDPTGRFLHQIVTPPAAAAASAAAAAPASAPVEGTDFKATGFFSLPDGYTVKSGFDVARATKKAEDIPQDFYASLSAAQQASYDKLYDGDAAYTGLLRLEIPLHYTAPSAPPSVEWSFLNSPPMAAAPGAAAQQQQQHS